MSSWTCPICRTRTNEPPEVDEAMVERVARALCDEDTGGPYRWRDGHEGNPERAYRASARAALTAITEDTQMGAYHNALREEGSRDDLLAALGKPWEEIERLRAELETQKMYNLQHAATNLRHVNEIERLRDKLDQITAWANAYPETVFQEPSESDIRKWTEAIGPNAITALHGSWGRHITEGVRAICDHKEHTD